MAANDKVDFIHKISGKEAEQLLLSKGIDGSFLVRTSASDRNVYAVSYRTENQVCHIRFQTTEEGFTAEGLPDEYPTIGELILAVQKTSIGFDYPLWPSDPAPPRLEPRLFFGRLTSKHAEKLLLDPDTTPERNFLIRSSTSRSKDYVLSIRQPDRSILHVLINYEGGKYVAKAASGDTHFDSFEDILHKYTNKKTNTMRGPNGEEVEIMKAMICPWNVDQSIIKNDIAPPAKPVKKKQNDIDRARIQKEHEATRIHKEYEQLQSESCTSKVDCEFARKQENISKNRYKNILPYDATRVILYPPPDYINASYLTPNKCEQYWPKNLKQEQLYQQFHVTAQEKVLSGEDYIISRLLLQNGDEKMEVYHCHYTGWPDKSVPTDIKALVKFCHEVLRLRNTVITDPRQGPIVAHCSAGIGRTGTYVLISMIIDHMQKFGETPDILSLAKTLRKQRPGMVQTVQQYQLVYEAINSCKEKYTQTSGVAYGNVGLASGVNVYGNVSEPS